MRTAPTWIGYCNNSISSNNNSNYMQRYRGSSRQFHHSRTIRYGNQCHFYFDFKIFMSSAILQGFDTIDRLKQQQPDLCPYAGSFQQHQSNSNRNCNTLGRIKTLEMTEYQKQKLLDEANTVRIRESKEYTLSLGR